MSFGVIGQKCGMTRIFTDEGQSIQVTVIQVLPNRITQLKTSEKEGYDAYQVAFGIKKASRVNKSESGHFAKANIEPAQLLREFRVKPDELNKFKLGDELAIDTFKIGEFVDVQGVTKGKGFAGTIKRHHFSSQDATHGNSLSHRVPGSIGQRQTPGRVFKGKKMSGHMGNVNRTAQNLEVIKIDLSRRLIIVKGAVPGAPGGHLIITHAVKGELRA